MKRLPWLTLAVFATTAVVTGAQVFVPWLLPALQRQPSMLAGEPWRFVTAWLVHDGGWRQIAFNFTALAVVGTLAELRIGRWPWIAAYGLGGFAGEIAGVFWQPVGAGNSVAISGVAAMLAVDVGADRALPMPQRLGYPLVLAAAALWLTAVRDIHGPPLLTGFIIGAALLLRRRMT